MAYRIHKLQYPHRMVHMATGFAMGEGEQVFVQVWGQNLEGGEVGDTQGNKYLPVIETGEWAFFVGSLRHPLAPNDSINFESKQPPKELEDGTPDYASYPSSEVPLVVAMGYTSGKFSAEAAEALFEISGEGKDVEDVDDEFTETANTGC